MLYIGNGIYSESGPDTLAHYGVLGMKWGIRKDREFRSDLNWHDANKKIRKVKSDNKLSKKKKKQTIRDIKRSTRAKNYSMKYDYSDYKPDKNGKVSDIYKTNMYRAQKEIPHYKAKHAIRKAGKILGTATLAAAPISGLSAGAGFASGFAKTAGALGAAGKSMATGYGIGYGAGQAALGIATRKIPKRIVRGKL